MLTLMWCDKWLFIEIDIAWYIQMALEPSPRRLRIYAQTEKGFPAKSRNKKHDLSA